MLISSIDNNVILLDDKTHIIINGSTENTFESKI